MLRPGKILKTTVEGNEVHEIGYDLLTTMGDGDVRVRLPNALKSKFKRRTVRTPF